jgi:Ca2+-binding RTX toxin-like protein
MAAPVCARDGDVLRITLSDSRGRVVLERDGDEIRWGPRTEDPDKNSCRGEPTVQNVDRVRVEDDTSRLPVSAFGVSLSGGYFEPGRTKEGDGTSEIEFTYNAGDGGDYFGVHGGGGNDEVTSGRHGVNLRADDDPDVTLIGVTRVTLTGGAGRDTLSGAGGQSTGRPDKRGINLFGDNGDDRLIGTRQNDFVTGGGGWDAIRGGMGPDNLNGMDGNDYIAGGSGPDRVHGGAGNDHSMGQAGSDEVVNRFGKDDLIGGDGPDTLEGGKHDERLYGNGGSDELDGAGGDDFLAGHGGDDDLDGGNGSDECRGGEGNNTTTGCES